MPIPALLGFRLVARPWVPRLAVRSGPLPVSARATAGPLAAVPALAPALGDVRQQRKLARALDCARDLALMAAARSRDPARADLAALGDEAAQRGNVLVVDLVDLLTAVWAGLAPTRGRSVFPVASGASRPFTLLCHSGFLWLWVCFVGGRRTGCRRQLGRLREWSRNRRCRSRRRCPSPGRC